MEQFGIVLLDAKHRVMRTAVLAVGTLNSSVVEPRDVFREAAIGGATAIVIFHNHPSGDPTPSPEDVALTRRLVAAGSLIGIDVVDHVILGDVRYCSIKETRQRVSRVLYFDCFSGISGDMTLGALLDAGSAARRR